MEFLKASEVAEKISDYSTVATGGFVGIGVPEEVLIYLEKRFLEKKEPKGLTLIYAAGQGDGKQKGLNHIAYEGMIKKVIGGHWGLAPRLGELVLSNKVEGYNLPQGVISHLFRDMSAGKSGTISKIGIGTFVDPIIQGGKLNEITKEEIVKEIYIDGDRYLFFKAPQKIDYAILRGTYSDEDGNISFEKEALTLEDLSIAIATKNSGGKVIVQVENKVKNGSIDPKDVKIPGIFVDYVVVCEDLKNHMQTFDVEFEESFITGKVIKETMFKKTPLDERKIIARRCAQLLTENDKILNYGIGMPERIADVLKEANLEKKFTPTVEPGAIGGTPAGGLSFGASICPKSVLDQPYQFDFYDGGGLDIAFLGLAQCDKYGNINVSKFGKKVAGCGGFINISQNAKKVVFCGTFTAGGLNVKVENGELKIIEEGKKKKFINDVEQITFSAKTALKNSQPVYYITERAVFILKENGLNLIEIAPGVDLEKDIINLMDFKPIVSKDLKKMDEKIFEEAFYLEI